MLFRSYKNYAIDWVGGWAGVAMNLGLTNDTDALGAAGGYKELTKYNAAPGGGGLTVFSL